MWSHVASQYNPVNGYGFALFWCVRNTMASVETEEPMTWLRERFPRPDYTLRESTNAWSHDAEMEQRYGCCS